MDLLEYQAKELFRQVGIPTLPFQTIYTPRELKRLKVPYPVVLKSQVRVGGRGKAGGIRFVANTIDAIAAARNIFNLSILGEYPEVVLAEARYNAQQEFFLAIVLDYQLKCPVLFGSSQGGMNVETLLDNLQQVVVDTEFSPFYARRLTVKMGLSGDLIQSVSTVIEKMYRLFQAKDLDLIEINPLGVSPQGELMALDGKITANDLALARHLDIITLTNKDGNLSSQQKAGAEQVDLLSKVDSEQWLNWQDSKGKIAIICNSWDLAIITWDLVCQRKGKPACCVVIDDSRYSLNFSSASWQQELSRVLTEVEKISGIKVALVNILADKKVNSIIAQTLIESYQSLEQQKEKATGEDRSLVANGAKSRSHRQPHNQANSQPKKIPSVKIVVRLLDREIDCLTEDKPQNSVYWTDNLEEAVEKAVSLGKYR
ncbi:MAG: ATP-grasp domain-containing protein [Xenococcaceae cyanobacterium]